MKVGMLTFHNAWNYGGALQVFALQRVIASMGRECEIIDYKCPAIEKSYRVIEASGFLSFAKSSLRCSSTLQKRNAFRGFQRDYMVLSERSYVPSTIADSNAAYDCFAVGSDQIWNSCLTNADSIPLDQCAITPNEFADEKLFDEELIPTLLAPDQKWQSYWRRQEFWLKIKNNLMGYALIKAKKRLLNRGAK